MPGFCTPAPQMPSSVLEPLTKCKWSVMRTTTIAFVMTLAAVMSGQVPADQTQDRVFYFTHAPTVQSFQEVATAIRTITDIRQVTTDNAQKSLALRGTAPQIALAEWLFKELDKPGNEQPPAPQSQDPAIHEYRMTDDPRGEGVVRV